VREVMGWNLVSQTYVALENFCALFSALRASKKDAGIFAHEYLRFGRNETDLQGASVFQVLDNLLGRNGARTVSETLSIPLSLSDVEAYGLANCGVSPESLIAAGKFSRDVTLRNLQLLALAFIDERDPSSGRAIKSVPAKAYGAFRHGFAAGFPLHSPSSILICDAHDTFASEEAFVEYYHRAHFMAQIMYLDERQPDGTRPIQSVIPPVYTKQLKPFVRIIYLASKLSYEVAKYARSFFGSVDLRFPYLVNSVYVLGKDRRAILQRRLDELEGM
jgi:hypothetical protein